MIMIDVAQSVSESIILSTHNQSHCILSPLIYSKDLMFRNLSYRLILQRRLESNKNIGTFSLLDLSNTEGTTGE